MPSESIAQKVINSKKQCNLVIAAAGSGKTSLLIDILVRKIRAGLVDPINDEVIVFTFTNNAAEELAVRLTKLLSDKEDFLNRIFIGTIHGWCNSYLRKNGALANTKVIDELEQYQLLIRIYPLLSLKDNYKEGIKFDKIEAFVDDLEFFYNEDLEINDGIIPKKVKESISEYIDFIKSQRLLDFGSLIREAIRQLRSRNLPKKYHLFIDEYQDVNLAQVRLFQTLLSFDKTSSLFAVGDPRQSIYQWRGGDLRRILNFSEDFTETSTFTMDVNYRSRQGIIEFANIVARDMDFSSWASSPVKITDMKVSEKRLDHGISVIHKMGNFQQEEKIVSLINELHKEGVKYSDIAILMRSVVNHSDALMNKLEQAQIPYYSPNKNAGIKFIEEFMCSTMTLMELMLNPNEPANRQEEEEIEEKVERSLRLIKQYTKKSSTSEIHNAVSLWYSELSTPRKSRKGKTYFLNEAYNFRKQFFNFCKQIGFSLDNSTAEVQEGFSAITQIMRAVEEIYRRRFRTSGAWLRAPPIEVFLRNLKWQLNHEIERWAETGMEVSDGGDRITISTVHAAKGLEWPVVLVPFLWARSFPVRNSSHGTSFPDEIAAHYGTTVEDEKRLWYVAITRARDRFYYLSGSENEEKTPSCFTYSKQLCNSTLMAETSATLDQAKLSVVVHHAREFYLKIGVSNLLLMIDCPFQFYLRRVKGINVPVGQQFGAGNVLHKVIERLVAEPGVDYKQVIEEEVYLPLAERYFEEQKKKVIMKRIKSLIDSGYLSGIKFGETQFKIVIRNMVIVGIIDAIRETPEGLDVIDWKSSIHESLRSRYENQIRIYTQALRLKGKDVRKGLIYNLSQLTCNPSGCTVEIDISPSKIEKLIERAEKNLNILTSCTPEATPDPIVCGACDVSSICLYCWQSKEAQKDDD